MERHYYDKHIESVRQASSGFVFVIMMNEYLLDIFILFRHFHRNSWKLQIQLLSCLSIALPFSRHPQTFFRFFPQSEKRYLLSVVGTGIFHTGSHSPNFVRTIQKKIFLLDGTVKKRTSFKKRSAAFGSVFILWHCISLIGFYYFSVRYKSTIKALTSHQKNPDQSTDTCSCRRPADCHPACAAAMRKLCSLWPLRQAMTLPAWDIFCFSHVAPISRSFVAKFLWHSGRCLSLTPLTASASAESTIETFLGIFYASLRKPPISHSSSSSRQNFCDTRVAVCFDFVTAVHYAGSRE